MPGTPPLPLLAQLAIASPVVPVAAVPTPAVAARMNAAAAAALGRPAIAVGVPVAAVGAPVAAPAPVAVHVAAPSAVSAPAPAAGVVASADFTKSPFSGVMRWAPDTLHPRDVTPEDIVRFFLMIQDVYGGIAQSAKLPEGLQVMWAAAFYLKRFGKVTYSPEMSSFTANGVCGFVRPVGHLAAPAAFVKFKVKATADDPRCDAINSVVMAKILENESVKSGNPPTMMHGSILKFSDAFLGVLETFGAPPPHGMPRTYYYNLAQQIVEGRLLQVHGFFDVPNEMREALKAAEQLSAAAAGAVPGSDKFREGADLTFADESRSISYLNLLQMENRGALLAPAVAFDAISGVSLRTLIQKLSATDSFLPISERLDYLFKVMRVIGKYGWVHNDLHLNNILYDRVADRLVLIDYGRTFMDPRTLPTDIKDFANREMLKLDMLLDKKDLVEVANAAGGSGIAAALASRYSNFTDDTYYNTSLPLISHHVVAGLRGAPANFGKCLFMYDLATVTLGIMKRATVEHATAQKVAEEFGQAFSDTGIAEFEDNRMLILDIDSFISVLQSPVVANIPGHMNVILLGLLWTSMVMTAMRDEALHRGEKYPAVSTITVAGTNQDVMIVDFVSLSKVGIMFIGGLQFLRPCVDARVLRMFPRIEGYIQTYFDTGYLVEPAAVAPAAAAAAAVPGGSARSGGMFSAARSAAMRSRFAPSVARSAKLRSDRKPAAAPLDPSLIADTRRDKPTAWARKALAEYVSPLAALPPVFLLDSEGNVIPVKVAPSSVTGGGWKKRGAKRASAGAKRGGEGAAPASAGEAMRRVRAMLQTLPADNVKKTERLVAELENMRPFVLERGGSDVVPRSSPRSSPRS